MVPDYVSQQLTPFWSPELFTLGVPQEAMWVLLLWWADYCGRPGSCDWLLVWLIARPYLVQMLPVACWQDWVVTLGAGSLGYLWLTVGQSQVLGWVVTKQGFPDLVLDCLWVGLVPDKSGWRFQYSSSLCWLAGVTGSQGGWLWWIHGNSVLVLTCS